MDEKFVLHGPVPLEALPTITMGEIIYRSLRNNSNERDALVDAKTRETMSHSQLLEETCLLAESLQHFGCKHGDVISVLSENSVFFFHPVIAALYVGVIVAPLNPNYSKDELLHATSISKPRILFCSKNAIAKIANISISSVEKIVVLDSQERVSGYDNLDDFLMSYSRNYALRKKFSPIHFDVHHPAYILSSSGTTGLPKGVLITHRNLAVKSLHDRDNRLTQLCSSDTVLGSLPFFHGYGIVVYLNSIIVGSKVVVLSTFQEEFFLRTIQDYKITMLYLVPPIMVLLCKSYLVDKYDLSNIKNINFGAAPTSQDTIELVKKRLKVKSVRQGYGCTEATMSTILTQVGDYRPGSTGKLLPYMSAIIRDPETGKALGPNQHGEICLKGPLVMKGYHGNEQATRETFDKNDWLRTGDLGYYDDDEYFYIVDRLKELIKYKGFQVPPAELEALLLKHKNIKDAGVVGVPDETSGELPLAFVVKYPDSTLTEKEVQNYVADHVSSPKRLRGGVVFVDNIPKNASGKILRRELRHMLKKFQSKL